MPRLYMPRYTRVLCTILSPKKGMLCQLLLRIIHLLMHSTLPTGFLLFPRISPRSVISGGMRSVSYLTSVNSIVMTESRMHGGSGSVLGSFRACETALKGVTENRTTENETEWNSGSVIITASHVLAGGPPPESILQSPPRYPSFPSFGPSCHHVRHPKRPKSNPVRGTGTQCTYAMS